MEQLQPPVSIRKDGRTMGSDNIELLTNISGHPPLEFLLRG